MRLLAPSHPKDRFDVYRFFNGLSSDAKEGIDQRHSRVPLVKTFLIEHVSSRGNGRARPPQDIFTSLGAQVEIIDDRFMGLAFDVAEEEHSRTRRMTTGFLEKYDERFFAYYTAEDSTEARRRVGTWVQAPDLDSAWFSSPLLQVMWDQDVSNRGDDRFGKLVFRHESIFDMPEDFALAEESSDETPEATAEEEESSKEERPEPERRRASFEMRDRIGRIRGALSKLQGDYDPLHALHALRLPSRMGHGAHDLYQNGQVTNRTDSFEDHRNTVRYLYRIYKSILDFTEESAWQAMDKTKTLNVGMKGVPLIVRFAEPLSVATFDRWVQMAFRKRNQFKLWGDPVRLGPRKVHVYGADRHLWQPINLELTEKSVVAILPQGTCGNTFHRLVTNIQRYVCPKVEAWIGGSPFGDVVRRWPANAERADEN